MSLKMKLFKSNQQGFALIIPIVAVVLVLGIAGTQVYRVQQSNRQDAQLKANQKEAEDKLKLANDLKQANEAKIDQKTDEKKDDDKQIDRASAPPEVTKPPTTTAPKPSQPSIVHPTTADCGKGAFTVFASVKSGTKAYTSSSGSSVLATYGYGNALKLECYTDANGKPSGSWLLYNDGFIKYSDVSKSKV